MAIPYLTLDPNTGLPVEIHEDGTVLPLAGTAAPTMPSGPQTGGTDAGSLQGSAAPAAQDPIWSQSAAGSADTQGSSGHAGGYASSRRSGGYGGSSDRSSSGYDYDQSGSDDQEYPRYPDGRLHPAWGGDPLIPGGAAAESAADDSRTYVPDPPYSPGPPQIGSYGAGDSAGGGGGFTRGLISELRGNVMGKVSGMLGGSSGYSATSSTQAANDPKMRGEYGRGMDPSQAFGLSLRPTALLPEVFGKGFSPADPTYARLAAMPAAQMAMLSGGYGGDPDDLANNLGNIYEGAAAGKVPSTARMIGQLGKSKGINEMFSGVKAGKNDYESYTNPGYVYGQEPLAMGEAAMSAAGLLDAALWGESEGVRMKYGATEPGSWGSYLIDKGSQKALRKPAGKGVPLNKYLSRRIFR